MKMLNKILPWFVFLLIFLLPTVVLWFILEPSTFWQRLITGFLCLIVLTGSFFTGLFMADFVEKTLKKASKE